MTAHDRAGGRPGFGWRLLAGCLPQLARTREPWLGTRHITVANVWEMLDKTTEDLRDEREAKQFWRVIAIVLFVLLVAAVGK